jgi:hypothetical protein
LGRGRALDDSPERRVDAERKCLSLAARHNRRLPVEHAGVDDELGVAFDAEHNQLV